MSVNLTPKTVPFSLTIYSSYGIFGVERKVKKFFVIALAAALLATGGVYAYTWTTGILTIGVGEPTGNLATSVNATENQPDWGSVTDNLTENTTCGEVPTGELFTITAAGAYSGDLKVEIYITNTGSLIKAYQYLNMKTYMAGSVSANETPNYRPLTLQNGQTTITLENLAPISGNFTQTTQAEFENGTLVNLDTTTSLDDVLLDTFADNATDNFTDETKIAASTNVTVSGGQVKLIAGGASGTETFRPNAAGDDTSIVSQYPDSGAHWDKVDEVTSDNYTTYVSTNSTTYQRDLFNIPDHSTGSGVIDSVTAYFRFANYPPVRAAVAYLSSGGDGFLKTAEIEPSGNITDATLDTLEYDPADGNFPDTIHISGDIYAIAYQGVLSDGFVSTVEIDSLGNITDTPIDTLEYNAAAGREPSITHVSGDVYAIAYDGPGGDGWLTTVEIDSLGNITDTAIDYFEFDGGDGDVPDITHVSGDVYVIAYNGVDADGWLVTVEIDSSGNITDAVIDTLEFDGVDGNFPDIIPVSGDVYAIVYQGFETDGFVITAEIDTSGNITDTLIDTLEFDPTRGAQPKIIDVADDIYAIAYSGSLGDGWLATVEIDSLGNITDAVIDTLEYDAVEGREPDIIRTVGNSYVIAYRGVDIDGWMATVEIDSLGNITDTVIDTLEFDVQDCRWPNLVLVSTLGDVYARAAVKTGGTVYTGSEESTASDTFVFKSYQWATNPSTNTTWTWDEIDALQIGIELRGGSAEGWSAGTQVYAEVDYTLYNSPGTLTSINLLSGETVPSIDIFNYNASTIPSGTGLRVQFSTDNTTWYNSANVSDGWDTMSQGTDTISLSGLGWSGPNFYYHMEFTSDGGDTPVLDTIAAIFSTYYSSGNLTSSKYDSVGNQDWESVLFTINELSGTDIKFQIRTAATEGGLDSAAWYGPTGTGDYYTTTGTGLNSVHDGDRWIQYKAYFSGPGDATPTLSDVSITYTSASFTYTVEIIGGGYCVLSDNTSEWGLGWATTPEFSYTITQR